MERAHGSPRRNLILLLPGGKRVAEVIHRPDGFWTRGLGLLIRPALEHGEGLWLDPCGGIHTCGVRYPIDVVFLSRTLTVLSVARNVRPWRLVPAPRGTVSVLELPAGAAAAIRDGMELFASEPEVKP